MRMQLGNALPKASLSSKSPRVPSEMVQKRTALVWRSEAHAAGRRTRVLRRATEGEELDGIQDDIARLRERDARSGGGSKVEVESVAGGGVQDIVDRVLVANFFVICGFLLWLVAGVVQRSVTESTTWLDAWLFLWQPIIQPSLGVEMLGAILSGVAGKFLKK